MDTALMDKSAVGPRPAGARMEEALKPQDLCALIVSDLEEDIVFGRLFPRERLIEEGLAQRFGAKRHVIRQALVELEYMGLVERIRNRGAFVRAYTPEEVEHLYVARGIAEQAAARLIPLPSPPGALDQVVEIQKHHDAAVEAGDLRSIFRINIAFHRALFSLSGNPYLCQMVDDLAQKAHAIRSLTVVNPTFLKQARDDHWRIIEAIQRGDRERLVQLCLDHLQPSKDSYISAYRRRFPD